MSQMFQIDKRQSSFLPTLRYFIPFTIINWGVTGHVINAYFFHLLPPTFRVRLWANSVMQLHFTLYQINPTLATLSLRRSGNSCSLLGTWLMSTTLCEHSKAGNLLQGNDNVIIPTGGQCHAHKNLNHEITTED